MTIRCTAFLLFALIFTPFAACPSPDEFLSNISEEYTKDSDAFKRSKEADAAYFKGYLLASFCPNIRIGGSPALELRPNDLYKFLDNIVKQKPLEWSMVENAINEYCSRIETFFETYRPNPQVPRVGSWYAIERRQACEMISRIEETTLILQALCSIYCFQNAFSEESRTNTATILNKTNDLVSKIATLIPTDPVENLKKTARENIQKYDEMIRGVEADAKFRIPVFRNRTPKEKLKPVTRMLAWLSQENQRSPISKKLESELDDVATMLKTHEDDTLALGPEEFNTLKEKVYASYNAENTRFLTNDLTGKEFSDALERIISMDFNIQNSLEILARSAFLQSGMEDSYYIQAYIDLWLDSRSRRLTLEKKYPGVAAEHSKIKIAFEEHKKRAPHMPQPFRPDTITPAKKPAKPSCDIEKTPKSPHDGDVAASGGTYVNRPRRDGITQPARPRRRDILKELFAPQEHDGACEEKGSMTQVIPASLVDLIQNPRLTEENFSRAFNEVVHSISKTFALHPAHYNLPAFLNTNLVAPFVEAHPEWRTTHDKQHIVNIIAAAVACHEVLAECAITTDQVIDAANLLNSTRFQIALLAQKPLKAIEDASNEMTSYFYR